jgi:hypothetical protein
MLVPQARRIRIPLTTMIAIFAERRICIERIDHERDLMMKNDLKFHISFNLRDTLMGIGEFFGEDIYKGPPRFSGISLSFEVRVKC